MLRQLKIPFRETVVVVQTVPNFPASRVLRPGDVLTAVDGRPATSLTATDLIDDRRAWRARHDHGRPPRCVPDIPHRHQSGSGGQSAIGVYLAGYFAFPFTVRSNGSSCSGNGCDLMFALALMDKLTPLNLTSGAFVAGAGTLDDTGDVGPASGIYVLLADLRGQGATVFLTPAANCAQALRSRAAGLRLVKVRTLGGAVRALGGAAGRTSGPVLRCLRASTPGPIHPESTRKGDRAMISHDNGCHETSVADC